MLATENLMPSNSSSPVSTSDSPVQEVKVDYNDCTLTLQRVGGKTGGKTKSSEYNGFFVDKETGQRYLLKQPDQKKLEGRIELLTEPLAGVVLQGCKDAKLIKPADHASFICADWAKLADGSYVVIQPEAKGMKELFKYLYEGTEYAKETDRHPGFEIYEYEKGNNLYSKVRVLEPALEKLATIILWALITGNNSIHSGNIGYRKKSVANKIEAGIQLSEEKEDEDGYQLVEADNIEWLLFDLGAAFRYFCHAKNIRVLDPYEYQFSFRAFTKGYIYYYLRIPGLWEKISKQGQSLLQEIALQGGEEVFIKIFGKASQNIPAAVLANGRQEEMQRYLFADPEEVDKFAQAMGKRMHERLVDITALSKDRVFALEIETLRMQQKEQTKQLAALKEKRQKERKEQEIEYKKKEENLLRDKEKEKKEKEQVSNELAQKEEIIARQKLELEEKQKEIEDQQIHIAQQHLLDSLEKKEQKTRHDFQIAEIRYQNNIQNYETQKEHCNDAMTFCFGFSAIGSCSAIGIISFCGGVAVAGIWLVSATCVVPLFAVMYGFYCYSKASQMENMHVIAENLWIDLLKNKDERSKKTTQRLFELMAAVELLDSVSVKQKQQLYRQLRMVAETNKESNGDTFKTAFQQSIAEFKIAEEANQTSFLGLFGRRPNQQLIDVFDKFQQEEKIFLMN